MQTSTKLSKQIVKLTRLYGMVMITLNKTHRKIKCYHLENGKNSVKYKNNRKKKDCDYDEKRKI